MNTFAGIFGTAMALVVVEIATFIGNIVNGRPPMWVRRWARNAKRGAEIAAGIAGLYLVLCGLLVAGGIQHNSPVTMYVGFTLVAVFTMFTKAFVSLFEKLAKNIWVKLAWLATFGHTDTTVAPIVHDTLIDIGMCMVMCSVFALDGQEIGLTLNAMGWASIASLVALVIMSGAKITIRRKIMGGVTALFAITFVAFQFMPAFREEVQAAAEHSQVGMRRAADVIRPNMPLAEVRLHQETEAAVMQSELVRYTAVVSNFQRAAANHTPTPAEIETYQKAMENVTTLREALKLRIPESPQVGYARIAGYSAIGIAIFITLLFTIIIPIIGAIPKGGLPATAAGTTPAGQNAPANPAAPVATGTAPTTPAPTAHGGGHGSSGGGNGWKWAAALATVIGLVLLGFVAFGSSRTYASSSVVYPPAATTAFIPVTPTVEPPQGTAVPTQEYAVLNETPDSGRYQTDARIIWQKMGTLKLQPGDTLKWKAKGTGCSMVPGGYRCNGPDGFQPPLGIIPWAESSTTNPQEFEVGHAHVRALLIKIGTMKMEAGSSGSYTVPAGAGTDLDIETMRNIRTPDISGASGGDEIELEIIRKI